MTDGAELLLGLLFELGQLDGQAIRLGVAGEVAVRLAGDDERRARLVDEDVIDFVDDGVVEVALALVRLGRIVRIASACRLPCCRADSRSRTRC